MFEVILILAVTFVFIHYGILVTPENGIISILVQLLILVLYVIVANELGVFGNNSFTIEALHNTRRKMEERYWNAASVSKICSKFVKTSQIRKYYEQHPEEFKNDEKLYAQKEYGDYIKYKREFIIKRVFAYDYEEMLYEIYAPFAKPCINGWKATPIDKDYMLNQIAELKRVSKNKAESIYNQLYLNGLLHCKKIAVEEDGEFFFKYQIILDNMLDSLKPYDGLKFNIWSIVTDKDMNLSKWMERNDYKRK